MYLNNSNDNGYKGLEEIGFTSITGNRGTLFLFILFGTSSNFTCFMSLWG